MASLLGRVTFSPIITGGLLYLLTKAPEQYRLPVIAFLESKLSTISIERLLVGIKTLCVLGIVRQVNIKLNSLAFTHWRMNARKDRWHWNSEVAIVTGGSLGIGKGTVASLYSKGMKVAIFDIVEPPMEFGGKQRIMYVKCHITSHEAIKEAVQAVREKFGHPSILVNNAGIQKFLSILEAPDEYVTKIYEVNMIAHYWTVKECLPDMIKKNKGHIVGVASMASFIGAPGVIPYSCTKAGVLAFHEGLAGEIKHVYNARGILLTKVHPSWVDTPMVASFEEETKAKVEGAMTIEYLGDTIAKQIMSCRGAQLILPDQYLIKTGTIMRALPNWMQEGMRDIAVTAVDLATSQLKLRSTHRPGSL